jgi:uncharacterized phage infection (PIP) family protein YhgE
MASLSERIDLHVHVHEGDLDELVRTMREQTCLLQEVLARLSAQQQELETMSGTISQGLQDLATSIPGTEDAEDKALALIQGIKDQMAQNANDAAKIAELRTELDNHTAALVAAMAPATEPPGPVPTPVPTPEPTPDPNPAPAPDPNQQPGVGAPPADGTAPGAPVIT